MKQSLSVCIAYFFSIIFYFLTHLELETELREFHIFPICF